LALHHCITDLDDVPFPLHEVPVVTEEQSGSGIMLIKLALCRKFVWSFAKVNYDS